MRITGRPTIRTWLTRRNLWQALSIWTFFYVAIGSTFGYIFLCHPLWLSRNDDDFDPFYFSFTTLATVGYGDISPRSWNRLYASIEAFLGLAMNSTLLGLVVVALLRRRESPILFPDKLAFDVEDTTFWFRSLNVSDVAIVSPSFSISLSAPATAKGSERPSYDVVGGWLRLAYHNLPMMAPMVVQANRTGRLTKKSQGAVGLSLDVPDLSFPESDLVPSPIHLKSVKSNPQFEPFFTIIVNGYFSDTGQSFTSQKIYETSDVRCGAYPEIYTMTQRKKSLREIALEIRGPYERIISTSSDFCINRCPLHSECPLDVAVKARASGSNT